MEEDKGYVVFEPPIRPKRFAEMINVSVKTLQRWDREGILIARRTPTNRRYYTAAQYEEYMTGKKS